MKYYFFLLIFFHLIFIQGDLRSISVGRRTLLASYSSSRHKGDSSCTSCCIPGDPISLLTAKIYAPILSLSLLILIFLMFSGSKCFPKLTLSMLSKKFPYYGNFPDDGIYHGYYYQNRKWSFMERITLSFQKSTIKGFGIDEIGEYEWVGDYSNRLISLRKTYKLGTGNIYENFGHNVDIKLIPSKIEGTNNPILLGDYFEKRNKTKGSWFILPKNIKISKPDEYFNDCHSKRLIALYIILLLFTICSIIYWAINMAKYDFNYYFYADNLVNYQISAILSMIGLFFILIFHKRFKITLNKCSFTFLFLNYLPQLGIASICLSFGLIDMIVADFVKNHDLYYTNQGNIPDYPGITEDCNFTNFECSTIWTPGYDYADDSCIGYSRLLCVSYHSSMGSCFRGQDNIYNYLIGKSLFSLFLFILWMIFLFTQICLFKNVRTLYRGKLQELNQVISDIKIPNNKVLDFNEEKN